MKGLILPAATRLVLPLLLVFSIFLLTRGHDDPGGGFAGGLVAAAGFALLATASGVPAARAVLRLDPGLLIGLGLLVAVAAGSVGLIVGQPFLTAIWWETPTPIGTSLKIGSPLLFDLGVYLTVVGVAVGIIFALEEET